MIVQMSKTFFKYQKINKFFFDIMFFLTFFSATFVSNNFFNGIF